MEIPLQITFHELESSDAIETVLVIDMGAGRDVAELTPRAARTSGR